MNGANYTCGVRAVAFTGRLYYDTFCLALPTINPLVFHATYRLPRNFGAPRDPNVMSDRSRSSLCNIGSAFSKIVGPRNGVPGRSGPLLPLVIYKYSLFVM